MSERNTYARTHTHHHIDDRSQSTHVTTNKEQVHVIYHACMYGAAAAGREMGEWVAQRPIPSGRR